MAEKKQANEGVALNIPTTDSERFADGVPVSVPEDAKQAKSGQKAASKKES